MGKRKAPAGTYWRGNTLWGRAIVNGTEHRWSLHTDDAALAASRRKAHVDRLKAAAHHGDQRVTWEDAVLAWGEHITAHVGARTAQRYAVSLRQLEPFLLGCYLDEIDKTLASEIVRKRRAKGITTATIRRDLTALSSVLDFTIDEGWREDNPALMLMRRKRMKERREPIVLPEADHIRRVIARAPGNFARLIEAAWLTGCRQDELVTAQRRQIDHARRQLTVIGKGRKLRTIDLSPAAYDALKAVPVNMATRHIFWHSDGRHYANVASRFREFVRSVEAQSDGEFRPFRFHDLRHRFAVDYLKSGRGGIYDLQLYLGHSSVKVTEMYLAYLTPEEQARAKAAPAQNREHLQRFGNAEGIAD